MRITIVLCTYNRCRLLVKALESVAASTLPESVEWEVLVMDNNSNDQTREVVEDFCRRYPGRFRYLFEAQPGKSYALNSGIRDARGDIIAFLDDDLTVLPTWLQNLTEPLQGGEWAGVGGRILPLGNFRTPQWLSLKKPYDLGSVLFASFDFGDKPFDLDWAPYGANMAFRKAMFTRYGYFRTDLGPSPNKETPRPNEDTEFGRRLLAGGERLRYEPSATAYHPVSEERIRKGYFLSWWFDYGRAMARERAHRRPCIAMLVLATPAMVTSTRRWLLALDPQRRFYWKCHVWSAVGEISESYRLVWSESRRVGPNWGVANPF